MLDATSFRKKILANTIENIMRIRLEDFKNYVHEIELKFQRDKEHLLKSFDETIKGLRENEINEIVEYYAEENSKIEEVNIQLFRKSIIIMLYSFLENSLNSLCRHLKYLMDISIDLYDLRGSGIYRAKKFLENLANIDFSNLNKEWEYLSNLNKIRNCLVHTGGNIYRANNAENLRNIINGEPALKIKNDKYILIEKEYIDMCIVNIERFLKKLHRKVFN